MTDGTHPIDDDPKGPTPSVWLIARKAGKELKRLQLKPDDHEEKLVGSDPACTLCLDDKSVSRKHLAVRLRLGRVAVRDLGSTNGTKYQGSKLDQALLPLNAVLKVGHVELRLEPISNQRSSSFGRLVSVSPKMMSVLDELARVAPTDSGVLLEGPTGSGKEVCARALHENSPRAKRHFEPVDCGAMPASVAASELFGYERGAFTGADRAHEGALERAHFGTLFIDEVGELPLELQPLLLRVLESRQVKRLGGAAFKPLDLRVIAATHRNLDDEVAHGRFRADLLHRLAVVRIKLPPLADRLDDLGLLARDLLDGFGERAVGFNLSPETLDELRRQPWPGNIRELKNFLERAVSLGELKGASSAAVLPWPDDYRVAREHALDSFERDFARHIVDRFSGNVSRAAREAGIGRAYLHRLIKKHSLG